MSDFDLRFKGALNTTHPVDLVFNAGGESAGNNVVLNATIDPPQLSSVVRALRNAYLSDSVPAPILSSTVVSTSVAVLNASVPAPNLTSLSFVQANVELSATIDAPVLNAVVIGLRTATLSGVIDPPTLASSVVSVNSIFATASIDPPSMTSTLHYDNAVNRGLRASFGDAWQSADRLADDFESKSQQSDPNAVYVTSTVSNTDKLNQQSVVPSENTISTNRDASLDWSNALSVSSGSGSQFNALSIFRVSTSPLWSVAIPVSQASNVLHDEMLRQPRTTNLVRWGMSDWRHQLSDSGFNVAKNRPVSKLGPWGVAMRPNYGRTVKPTVPPIDDGYKPPSGIAVNLLFKEKATTDTHVLFGIKQYVPAKKIVPVKRAYIVMNTFDLVVLATGSRIETYTMEMTIDMDSWTWGFNANIAAKELPKILPSGAPVIVVATVNGEPFRFIVESRRRSRSFGKEAIGISGRGVSALLADPYSPVMNFTNTQSRTANQLADDALLLNGVSIGWAVDWQIEDWLVPTGAWSHQGTYMSAITTIVASAGAFVQPDPVNNILRILPRNKVKPWELSTSSADIEIPSAVIETESVTWEDRAEYDSVYVSGTTSDGVLGLVRRTGTAGDKPAPMVTDPLITDAVAARQRGIFELSRYGSVVKRELNFPVLSETGIVMPGATMQYTDNGISNTGFVNSVRVNVSLPSIRQQISITSYD